MSKIQVKMDDFLWLLECGDFNQSASGIILECDNDKLYFNSCIGNRFNISTFIKTQEKTTKDSIKIINGKSKEGIGKLIQDLKVIKHPKELMLEIQNDEDILTYQSKSVLQKRKIKNSTIIQEHENFKNYDEIYLFPIHDTIEFDIDKDIMKSVIDAQTKSSSILSRGVISIKDNGTKSYFMIGDVDNSKRFGIDICESKYSFDEIIINFNLSVINQLLSKFDQINLKYNPKNKLFLFSAIEEKINKDEEIDNEILKGCNILVGNLSILDETDDLPF